MRDGSTLEILMGAAKGGKTARLLAEYIDVLTSGRGRVLWIAPAQAAADEVRTALALSLGEAVLEPGVTTFPGLSDSILKEAGRLVRVVTPLERRRLLRQVIDGAATDGALKHFQAVAGSTGLLDLADRTIARLKRGDVSPDEFAGSSTTLPRREIAELYGRYEARLRAAKLTDADGLLQVARDVLRERTDIAAGLELAVVDGFTDFSLVQWQILQQLVQRSKRTAVTLPGDGAALLPTEGQSTRTDLFARAMIARQRLEEIGGTVVGPRPELAGGDKMPARSSSRKIDASTQSLDMPPAMVHLERNLFRVYGASERVTAAVKKSASCIQIIAASSEQAEIEEIARRVKELLVAGVPPGDVVVAFRSTSDVADRVRAAFADFGIPTHLDAPRKLAATP
jgi:ATP-dependent helicase/DNAse subunit B